MIPCGRGQYSASVGILQQDNSYFNPVAGDLSNHTPVNQDASELSDGDLAAQDNWPVHPLVESDAALRAKLLLVKITGELSLCQSVRNGTHPITRLL